jgi:hypothetical protein
MAAPPTLEKHTMWEAVPPGDSSARHGGQRELIALGVPLPVGRRIAGWTVSLATCCAGHPDIWSVVDGLAAPPVSVRFPIGIQVSGVLGFQPRHQVRLEIVEVLLFFHGVVFGIGDGELGLDVG